VVVGEGEEEAVVAGCSRACLDDCLHAVASGEW
jgi:hypothetical protein